MHDVSISSSVWLAMALLLAGCEMLTGTFYLMAMAAGSVLAAGVSWAGIGYGVQLTVMGVGSIATALLLKKYKYEADKTKREMLFDIGMTVTPVEWKTDRELTVMYRGTIWKAELEDGADPKASDYVIRSIKGLVLILKNSH